MPFNPPALLLHMSSYHPNEPVGGKKGMKTVAHRAARHDSWSCEKGSGIADEDRYRGSVAFGETRDQRPRQLAEVSEETESDAHGRQAALRLLPSNLSQNRLGMLESPTDAPHALTLPQTP
jgi:hypothetical protein